MLFYRLLAGAALLAYSPVALFQALAGRRRLGDLKGRLGRNPYPSLDGGIWVHAVSVGEVGVAASLLAALAQKAPGLRLGLSITTAAGRELGQQGGGDGRDPYRRVIVCRGAHRGRRHPLRRTIFSRG